MDEQRHIVAICGSMRDQSVTRTALQEALNAASEAGASTTLVDLREYDLPAYGSVKEGRDAGDAPALRKAVDAADGIILGTPIYHGSYSSPLKAALDYCGRDEFRDKTVGLVATAGGRFPTKGLEHLRNVARHINAWVLPTEVAIPNASDAISDGEVHDPEVKERLHRLGRDIVLYSNIARLPELLEAVDDAQIVSGKEL